MVKGIIFDKDGTLFDFNATWGAWTKVMLEEETDGDPVLFDRLATALGFDAAHNRFHPGSIVIAETAHTVAHTICSIIPDLTPAELLPRMNAAATQVPQQPAADLPTLMSDLRERGIALGIATNDSEAPARAHLDRAGIVDHFDFIAGADSGFGGKPAIGQLMAFCDQTGIAAGDCAMVGDSLHDIHAGNTAGMTSIGVLTGPAPREELALDADIVLNTIADIPAWLDTTIA